MTRLDPLAEAVQGLLDRACPRFPYLGLLVVEAHEAPGPRGPGVRFVLEGGPTGSLVGTPALRAMSTAAEHGHRGVGG